MITAIRITYGVETVTLTVDLADATSPLPASSRSSRINKISSCDLRST